ncbi:hypothetical protein DOY81_004634 [Sarcophaga bullata]|nr:hypothetical protein DOY81_004634 [Sarcophaga bullata]
MFKLVVVFALLVCAAAQRHGHGHGHAQSNGFARPSSHASADDAHAEIVAAQSDVVALAFIAAASAVGHYGGHSESHVSGEDAHAEIKSLESKVTDHGFHYSYETTNHISAAAEGDEHGNIKGNFYWISPEDKHVDISYVANEYGYQPSGDVLPTPPPIPEAILKAIAYIQAHPSHEDQHYAFVAAASALGHIGGHSESHVSGEDAHAEIKSLLNKVDEHGYEYSYETTNGIRASAVGDEHGNVHGDFEWVDHKGDHIAVQYLADENGYQPSSAVLPTPHPIPVAILKSLEYIRSHPAHEEHIVVVLALVAAVAAVGSEEAHAEIKSLESKVTDHAMKPPTISVLPLSDEHGNIKGNFYWISPEDKHVDISYVANEYGYQPSGDVLPTPPPIPEAILKAIAYIQAHPSHEENIMILFS